MQYNRVKYVEDKLTNEALRSKRTQWHFSDIEFGIQCVKRIPRNVSMRMNLYFMFDIW